MKILKTNTIEIKKSKFIAYLYDIEDIKEIKIILENLIYLQWGERCNVLNENWLNGQCVNIRTSVADDTGQKNGSALWDSESQRCLRIGATCIRIVEW